MVSSVLLLLGAVVAYGLFTTVSGLLKNIAAAKRSGLPYYVIRKPARPVVTQWAPRPWLLLN